MNTKRTNQNLDRTIDIHNTWVANRDAVYHGDCFGIAVSVGQGRAWRGGGTTTRDLDRTRTEDVSQATCRCPVCGFRVRPYLWEI